jgi:ATP-dependent RNA helicase SUPV3L1/SUV3
VAEVGENEVATGVAADTAIDATEVEVFYTFKWGRAPRADQGQRRERPQGKGKPKGKKGGPRGGNERGNKAQKFSAKPPRKEKAIDPDNPFAAALMGLKDGK